MRFVRVWKEMRGGDVICAGRIDRGGVLGMRGVPSKSASPVRSTLCISTDAAGAAALGYRVREEEDLKTALASTSHALHSSEHRGYQYSTHVEQAACANRLCQRPCCWVRAASVPVGA